jgi:hypothetical protein
LVSFCTLRTEMRRRTYFSSPEVIGGSDHGFGQLALNA